MNLSVFLGVIEIRKGFSSTNVMIAEFHKSTPIFKNFEDIVLTIFIFVQEV